MPLDDFNISDVTSWTNVQKSTYKSEEQEAAELHSESCFFSVSSSVSVISDSRLYIHCYTADKSWSMLVQLL